ncbi:hypothetical protein AcW1_008451 [Taiwanofungus camphoratus]|nr:hypothetical protein AcW1_008451 [Antrodia cinnamomea]
MFSASTMNLAGLGISAPIPLFVSSSLIEGQIILSTYLSVFETQADTASPASPAEEIILYPRIPRVQERATCRDHERVHLINTDDVNERGYEAEYEDEGVNKEQHKRRHSRAFHTKAVTRRASKPKPTRAYKGLEMGLNQSGGAFQKRKVGRAAKGTVGPRRASEPTVSPKCVGLGFDLPPSFFHQSGIYRPELRVAPSPSLLPTPFASDHLHKFQSRGITLSPLEPRKPWEAPSASLLPTPFAST